MAKPKHYTLSALAQAEIEHVSKQEDISVDQLLKCSVESARAFTATTYYVVSPWFKAQPRHDLEVFVVRRDGVPRLSQRMVLDIKSRELLSHVEAPLDDHDYYARRVIEETLLDSEMSSIK